MKSISVFCGSNAGYDPIYCKSASLLGKSLAERNIDLIYGGAKLGLMGEIANACLENGGKVIGIMPGFLENKEIAHTGLTQLIITETMHQRKSAMAERCDGVIAMPGGFGTLEEFFEMITWGQLGIHTKPVALLNIEGYYNSLMTFLKQSVEKGFLKQKNYEMILIDEDIDALLYKVENYVSPKTEKWIS